jgi:MFS family permease
VLTICLMVFLADVVSGIVSPTFALYAQSLGASLAFIGTLSAVVGLTRMMTSVPIGLFSDARGRKLTLTLGMLLFGLSTFLYTVVPTPALLIPARILSGLAQVSTFFIGAAYVGDIVSREERGMALGLYSTAMGLGFAVGPIVGGQLAAVSGIGASYQLAAVVALVGAAVAWFGLPERSRRSKTGVDSSRGQFWWVSKLRILATDLPLLAASVGQMLMSGVVFAGTISNFYPLYAASLSINEATIGSMFAVRAVISTLARMPTGLLTTRIPSSRLMLFALCLVLVAVSAMSWTTAPGMLYLFLAMEGLAFGMFLTAGQTFVTQHAAEEDRGTAIGIYGTAGSIGSIFGPLFLGFVAEIWGLTVVFWVTGVMVLLGIGLLWFIGQAQQRQERRAVVS